MHAPASPPQIPGKAFKPFDPIHFVLNRWWRILVMGILILFVLAPLAYLKRNNQYETGGTVLVSPNVDQILSPFDRTVFGNFNSFVETHTKRMSSEEILGKALASMPRDERLEILQKIKDDRTATAVLKKKIQIQHVPNSYLIDVRMSGSEKEGLAETINAVMQTYLHRLEEEQEGQNKRKLDYLSDELAEIKSEIKEKQDKQDEIATQLKARSFNEHKNPYFDSVVVIQEQYLLALAEQLKAESEISHAQKNIDTIGELDLSVQADEATSKDYALSLIDNWTYSKLQELRSTIDGLTDKNPDRIHVEERMAGMKEYLENYRTQLNEDFLNMLNEKRDFGLNEELLKAQNAHAASKEHSDALHLAWKEMEKQFNQSTQLIAQGQNLESEISLLRNRQKITEESLRRETLDAKAPLHVQIEEHALAPTAPSSTNLITLLGMLVVASFGASGGLFLAIEICDVRVQRQRDVEKALGCKAPAPIPVWKERGNAAWDAIEVRKHAASASSKAIRRLATRLNREREKEGLKIFLFVGASAGGASSVLSRNVAEAMSHCSAQVMYLKIESEDGDDTETAPLLQRARIARDFSDDCALSWLNKHVKWNRRVAHAQIKVDSPLYDDRASLKKLIQIASKNTDAIVISAPTLNSSDLSQFLVDQADVSVVVAHSHRTLYSELRRSIEFLYRSKLASFTTVLIGEKEDPLHRLAQIRDSILGSLQGPNPFARLMGLNQEAHHIHQNRKTKQQRKARKNFVDRKKNQEKNTVA